MNGCMNNSTGFCSHGFLLLFTHEWENCHCCMDNCSYRKMSFVINFKVTLKYTCGDAQFILLSSCDKVCSFLCGRCYKDYDQPLY